MSPSSVQAPLPAPAGEEVSLLDLLTPLVRRWRVVLFVPLLLALAGIGISFAMAPKYTATTTFSEESGRTGNLSGSLGSLAGLAGLAGELGLGELGSSVSPDYLASILESRELLDSTLVSTFPDPRRPGEHTSLLRLLDVKGRTPRELMSNGVQRLSKLTEPTVDRKTGIIVLNVELRDPGLAAAVANRMVQLLNQFNVNQRQTQSREQREFIGGRLAEAEKELHQAEQAQMTFLQENRQYTESPLLTFEFKRLERQVDTKQQVYLNLAKAYEDARIAEVRDTPSITVIDTAVPPVKRSSPHRLLIAIAALFVGAFIAVIVAYLMEFRRSDRQVNRPDYRAFSDAWAQTRTEMAATFGRTAR